MGNTFPASLRAVGDTRGLSATIELDNGRLTISAGETEIGSWDLKDIHLEPIPTGYRMAAEGDQILIELKDLESFNEALQNGSKRRLLRASRQSSPKAKPPVRKFEDVPAPRPDQAIRMRAVAVAPAPASKSLAEPKPAKTGRRGADTGMSRGRPAGTGPGWARKTLDFVDETLVRAQKRFGPYLPDWVFTRAMFALGVLGVIVTLIFPGLASTLLLIAGAMVIVVGAIVYSDPMLASSWLPGRTTATHVLLAGVGALLLGVLVGIIAG